MKKSLLLSFLFGFILSFAQKQLTIDRLGVVTDSVEIKYLKKEYKIIGVFHKVSPKSEVKYARILKEDRSGIPYWGYINLKKEEIIPPKYLSVSPFENGYILVKDNVEISTEYKCGSQKPCVRQERKAYYYFVDSQNKKVSDYFDEVKKDKSGDFYDCRINNIQKILDASSLKVVADSKGEYRILILNRGNDYRLKAYTNNREDFLDKEGKPLTGFKYKSIDSRNGFLFVGLYINSEVTKYTLLNPYTKIPFNNNLLIDYISESIKGSNTVIVRNEEKYFLINNNGFVKSKQYDYLKQYGSSILFLDKENIGLLNLKGKEVLKSPNIYIESHALRDTVDSPVYVFEKKDGTLNFIDIKKVKLKKTDAIYLNNLSETVSFTDKKSILENKYFVAIGKNKKKGVLDFNGKLLVPYIYEDINPVDNTGYFLATNLGLKTGLISANNTTILPFTNEYSASRDIYYIKDTTQINNIKSYFFIWKINDKVGTIDYANKTIDPFEFDFQEPYENFIAYGKNSKMGIMTKNGKVIPAEYNKSYALLENGIYYLFKDKNLVGIDENNNMVFKTDFILSYPKFAEPIVLDERLIYLRDQDTSYILNLNGSQFLKFYNKVWSYSNGIGISTDGILFDLYKNNYEYYYKDRFISNDFK
ncbi:WG repeat-containing protein [Chryseobacterium sp. G0162]|uniref:WG repeat-containing protein n=1 Tax=Chryseobacterium sp. G0162 TaxID=2487063 RepID=UPI000F4DC62A|nr:WG repeat-containing protein [Chryseobacterium sp. G0162]AZB09864.1 WG repeat-containing protein [Chryseobacterium sp. G0162]